MSEANGQGRICAAFIDLRDSTFVWAQDSEIAEQILARLTKRVIDSIVRWKGEIGNFTGDGFLLLFPQPDQAIHSLAQIIDSWEKDRQWALKRLPSPMLPEALMIRTGVSFGNFRRFEIDGRGNVGGAAINHASRCESAAKDHFGIAMPESRLSPGQRVFVTQSVFDAMDGHMGAFWFSSQVKTQFKGRETATKTGRESISESIWATWPREHVKPAQVEDLPANQLRKAADVASTLEIANVLMSAAGNTAPDLFKDDPTKRKIGDEARKALLSAIDHYEKAKTSVTAKSFPDQYAGIQIQLGYAHLRYGRLANGSERERHLESAARCLIDAKSRAQAADLLARSRTYLAEVYRLQAEVTGGSDRARLLKDADSMARQAIQLSEADSPIQALASNIRGPILAAQADAILGKARSKKLQEAVECQADALRVWTFASYPEEFARAKRNQGDTFIDQAKYQENLKERADRLEMAVEAYHDALKVYTLESNPNEFAITKNNLGMVYSQLAGLLEGQAKADAREKGLLAYDEALQAWTLESSPDCALVHNNLGSEFLKQAEESSAGNQKKELLQRALASFEPALRFWKGSPDGARVQSNIGYAQFQLSKLLKGALRREKLDQAIRAFKRTVKILDPEAFKGEHVVGQMNLGEALVDASTVFPEESRGQLRSQARNAFLAALELLPEDNKSEREVVSTYLEKLAE